MNKILVIDDELYFRKALIKYIREFGDEYQVVGDAGNGLQGIELLKKYNPDIVLIDITMPQMSGFDVIRYIRDNELPTKPIIISGYDKFEYAQQAIQLGVQDFLLKPITSADLKESLDKVIRVIEDERIKRKELYDLNQIQTANKAYMQHFAASQFIRKDISAEEMQRLAQEAGYDITLPWHTVFLYRIQVLPPKWNPGEKDLYYFTVENVFTNLLGSDLSCISFVNFQQSLCVILGMNQQRFLDRDIWLKNALKKTLETIDPTGSHQALVCIGQCHPSCSQIHDSYIEAFSIEKKLAFYEESGIHVFSESCLEGTENMNLQMNAQLEQKLLVALRQNDEALAKEVIRTFLESLNMLKLSTDHYMLHVQDMVNTIVAYAHEYGINDNILQNGNIFPDELKDSFYISEIESRLIHFTEFIIQQVSSSSVNSSTLSIRRIKEYIKTNYMNPDLKLEQIAMALDINLQYMCFIFKKQTNLTIGNYILQTRMDMAKRLFQQGKLNVSEVAYKVGFEDVSYFSKCFKKYFGVSPKKFSMKTLL